MGLGDGVKPLHANGGELSRRNAWARDGGEYGGLNWGAAGE